MIQESRTWGLEKPGGNGDLDLEPPPGHKPSRTAEQEEWTPWGCARPSLHFPSPTRRGEARDFPGATQLVCS